MRRPSAPGLRSLISMLVLLAQWSFCYAMITLALDLEAQRFWLRFENIGILAVPVAWFLFTVQYTRLDRWLNRWTGSLLFVIPLISIVLVFSDAWFHFYYSAIRPISSAGGPLVIGRGPWYLVALVNSYTLNMIGMGILVWRAVQYRDLYRRQMFALIGAILIPILVNVFYQLAPLQKPAFSIRIDLTPISFTLTAALIAFGV